MEVNKDIGKALWVDLTVKDAEVLKEFYEGAVGWQAGDHSMGDYNDFNMNSSIDGETLAGVCHTRGSNAGMPPVWIVYFCVENLKDSIKFVTQNGGEVIRDTVSVGQMGQYSVIKDPAGAVCALWEKAEESK